MKDQARWTLPTDPYYGEVSLALWAQALDTLVVPCMHEAGFTEVQMGWDASAPAAATLAGDGISEVFNEGLAAQFGYRMAPDPRDLLADEVAAAGGSLYETKSQAFHDQFEICNDEADAVMAGGTTAPPAGVDPSVSISSQMDRLHVDTSEPALAQAAASWRECMAPQGIIDLPDEPWPSGSRAMPMSLMERWDWTPVGTASADEIQVASTDAACRRSSGWFDTLYEAEWKLREAFVREHFSELEPLRLQSEADKARYQSIIAQGTK